MRLLEWLDDRTGVCAFAKRLLDEPIPGGARWRYVWGSTLTFVFALQVLTGVLLMTAYSPSATTAWSSVWYLQTQMPLGWLIRGLHHFGSHAMTILLPLHLLQVVLAKAYRAPRECNFWTGLLMLGAVSALGLTGYLLPWDQKGYWATRVATNIMALTPIVGDALQTVLVGGSEYGHATLTRFYTLHVMVLPGSLAVLLFAHVALLRRHGLTVPPGERTRPEGNFFPDQLLLDSVACAAVLGVLLVVACYAHRVLGAALLGAPADPASVDYPARPEWYFLFLYQWLKYFEGSMSAVVGAIIIPGAVAAAFFVFPFLERWVSPRFAHGPAVGLVVLVFVGTAYLTYAAWRDDRNPSDVVVEAIREKQQRGEALDEEERAVLRARRFHRQRALASRLARRVFELAGERGIPPAGPSELLASDPVTRGPRLFAAHCATCHRFNGHNGLGVALSEAATSSDLAGFASRTWVRGLLADPMADRYFGRMVTPDGEPAHTRMSKWIAQTLEQHEAEEDRRALFEDFDAVAAYLEFESLHPGALAMITGEETDADRANLPQALPPDLAADDPVIRGRRVFVSVCNTCHRYAGHQTGTRLAPEMLGHGSVDWIERMIANPGDDALYRSVGRERARMPAFENRLSERDRRLIATWLHSTREVGPITP